MTVLSARSTRATLKSVLIGWTRIRQKSIGRCSRPIRQFGVRRFDAPRLVRDTADGDTASSVRLDNSSDRYEREGVGCAVTDLAVDMLAADRRRQDGGRDELALFKRRYRAQACHLVAGESQRSG